jgi:hypothetical protein
MGDTGSTGKPPVGAIVAIAGGALLAIGSFLAWAEVSGGGTSATAKGIDGDDGFITLGAGIVAVLVGILLLRQAKRPLAVLAIVAGLVGGGVAVYDALTAEDSVRGELAEQAADQAGISTEQARTLLDELVDSGQVQLDISLGIGLYVVIAGGLLALVGGVLSLRGAPKEERAEPGSGWSAPPPSVADEPPTAAPPATPVSGAPPSAPPAPAPPPTEGAT